MINNVTSRLITHPVYEAHWETSNGDGVSGDGVDCSYGGDYSCHYEHRVCAPFHQGHGCQQIHCGVLREHKERACDIVITFLKVLYLTTAIGS